MEQSWLKSNQVLLSKKAVHASQLSLGIFSGQTQGVLTSCSRKVGHVFFFFSVDFWQPKKGTFSALTGEICFLDVSFFIKAWVDCQYSNWKTQQSTYMLATSLAAGWNVLISLTCVLSCLVHCFFLPDSSKRIDNIAVTSLFLYLVIENPEQNTCGGFRK